MTPEQFLGVLRAFLSAAAGYFVGTGLVDANTATQISGAVLSLAVAGWSIYSNRPSAIAPK